MHTKGYAALLTVHNGPGRTVVIRLVKLDTRYREEPCADLRHIIEHVARHVHHCPSGPVIRCSIEAAPVPCEHGEEHPLKDLETMNVT